MGITVNPNSSFNLLTNRMSQGDDVAMSSVDLGKSVGGADKAIKGFNNAATKFSDGDLQGGWNEFVDTLKNAQENGLLDLGEKLLRNGAAIASIDDLKKYLPDQGLKKLEGAGIFFDVVDGLNAYPKALDQYGKTIDHLGEAGKKFWNGNNSEGWNELKQAVKSDLMATLYMFQGGVKLSNSLPGVAQAAPFLAPINSLLDHVVNTAEAGPDHRGGSSSFGVEGRLVGSNTSKTFYDVDVEAARKKLNEARANANMVRAPGSSIQPSSDWGRDGYNINSKTGKAWRGEGNGV